MVDATIKERLSDEIKRAMKAGEKVRLGALRQVHAAIKQREVDERSDLDDAAALAVIDKLAKQRREAIEQYEAAEREDLAAQERAEFEIISELLPQPLTDAELEALIEAAIASTGAESIKDMGRVMAELKSHAQGRADMSRVSARVKSRLG
jgi:uncharacterized protein YqeY